jgi:hypothetical protein
MEIEPHKLDDIFRLGDEPFRPHGPIVRRQGKRGHSSEATSYRHGNAGLDAKGCRFFEEFSLLSRACWHRSARAPTEYIMLEPRASNDGVELFVVQVEIASMIGNRSSSANLCLRPATKAALRSLTLDQRLQEVADAPVHAA